MQQAADEAHSKWRDENSDFVAYLHLWRWYEDKREHLSTSQLRKACRTNFLSFIRMREWRDVYHQLKELVGELPPVRREGGEPPRRGGTEVRGRRGRGRQGPGAASAESDRRGRGATDAGAAI
jgi:hypothetical protein